MAHGFVQCAHHLSHWQKLVGPGSKEIAFFHVNCAFFYVHREWKIYLKMYGAWLVLFL